MPDVETCIECLNPEDECQCETCEVCESLTDYCNCVTCESCGTKGQEGDFEYDWSLVCSDCCSKCTLTKAMCTCCRFCELPECECHSEFGYAHYPPWEARGIVVPQIKCDGNWASQWPELDTDIDPVQEAATFYMLEGLSHGLPFMDGKVRVPSLVQSTQSIDKFIETFGEDNVTLALGLARKGEVEGKMQSIAMEAAWMLNKLTDEIVESLWAYCHIAISGEARHHRALGGRVFQGPRDRAWQAWRTVYDKVGPEGINDLATLFLEFEDDAFGGVPWANAAKVLYQYEKGTLGPDPMTNKRMFLDRVFTMVHNNGSLLNKVGWGSKQPVHLGDMYRILDAHASEVTQWEVLYGSARKSAQHIMEAWYAACERWHEREGTEFDAVHPREYTKKTKVCAGCNMMQGNGHSYGCAYSASYYKKIGKKPEYTSKFLYELKALKQPYALYDENFNVTPPPVNVDSVVWHKAKSNTWHTEQVDIQVVDGKFELPKKIPGGIHASNNMVKMHLSSDVDVTGFGGGIQIIIQYFHDHYDTGASKWQLRDIQGHWYMMGSLTVDIEKITKSYFEGKDYTRL